jgi:hypothetical protein
MTVTAVKFPGQNVDVASHFPPLSFDMVVCVFGSDLRDLWWSAQEQQTASQTNVHIM